jgi:transposase
MDSGARARVGAVPPDRDAAPGRVCEPFPPERRARGDWRLACPLDPVAMESPGLDGGPSVERLEPHGRTPARVKARQGKTVPGRQPAGHEAQGLQPLHTLG